MARKLIFLSHIHEEKDLAAVLQQSIEDEFGGFVDVFVSSDGYSIPAGTNFLKRIEDGLTACVAGIFLISPNSVRRNWINFELGAVWIRSILSMRGGGPEIPVIPVCHSGVTPDSLPAPLNSLNAILGNRPKDLEIAFASMQTSVGGRGRFRTDFQCLAQKVIVFEQQYNIGDRVKRLLTLIGAERIAYLVQECKRLKVGCVTINCGAMENGQIQAIRSLVTEELSGVIELTIKNAGTFFRADKTFN
jgi:hypothetical protein